jgi:hypothetical protein
MMLCMRVTSRVRSWLAVMDWAKNKRRELMAREKRVAAEVERVVDRALLQEIRRSAEFRAPRLDWTGQKKKRAQARDARLVAEWLARCGRK